MGGRLRPTLAPPHRRLALPPSTLTKCMLFALFCRACHAYNTNEPLNECDACSGTELEWEEPEWEEPEWPKCPHCRGRGYENCSKCEGNLIGCDDCYKGLKCKAHSLCSLARANQLIYG